MRHMRLSGVKDTLRGGEIRWQAGLTDAAKGGADED